MLRLTELLRAPAPADHGPGRPWRPGIPAPGSVDPDTPSADVRIGYARCSTLTRGPRTQLGAPVELVLRTLRIVGADTLVDRRPTLREALRA